MHVAVAFSDVHSFCSHPCAAGCLDVSIRHVALAQRWRQRPALHWVVFPHPPSRSGCESQAWIRHPRLPTHYFLSRIENEKGWWLRARCFRPCEWLWGSSAYVVLLEQHRCDPGWKSFLVLVWRSPEGCIIPSFHSEFSVILDAISNLSVHCHLSKQRPPSVYDASCYLSYQARPSLAEITFKCCILVFDVQQIWWKFETNRAVNEDSGDFITAQCQTQEEKIEKELVKMNLRSNTLNTEDSKNCKGLQCI